MNTIENMIPDMEKNLAELNVLEKDFRNLTIVNQKVKDWFAKINIQVNVEFSYHTREKKKTLSANVDYTKGFNDLFYTDSLLVYTEQYIMESDYYSNPWDYTFTKKVSAAYKKVKKLLMMTKN